MNMKIVMSSMVAVAISASAFAQDGYVFEADTREPLPDIVQGSPDAPVTVIEYGSYSCSHCGSFAKDVYPKLKEEYIDTGKVKFVFREVIWDGVAMLGALTARCMPDDKYYAMSELLLQQQDKWAFGQESTEGMKSELAKFSALAGMSKDDLNACLADMENPEAEGAQERLEAIFNLSKERAEEAGVKGTPTVLVNGEAVGDWSWENLSKQIDKAL